MESQDELSKPLILQPCIAGGHISEGAVFQPLVEAIQSSASKRSDEIYRDWFTEIQEQEYPPNILDARLGRRLDAAYMMQHLWQHAWEHGDGSCITVGNVITAFDSADLRAYFTRGLPSNSEVHPGRRLDSLYREIDRSIMGRLPSNDEVLIAAPHEWEEFKAYCVESATGKIGITAIVPLRGLFESPGAFYRKLSGDIYWQLLSSVLSAMESSVAFAPRRYISGEEILRWCSLADEYNAEWADAATEWMEGEL